MLLEEGHQRSPRYRNCVGPGVGEKGRRRQPVNANAWFDLTPGGEIVCDIDDDYLELFDAFLVEDGVHRSLCTMAQASNNDHHRQLQRCGIRFMFHDRECTLPIMSFVDDRQRADGRDLSPA
jgi:hypothetical protein